MRKVVGLQKFANLKIMMLRTGERQPTPTNWRTISGRSFQPVIRLLFHLFSLYLCHVQVLFEQKEERGSAIGETRQFLQGYWRRRN
jgi:hypothetical protein